MCTECHICEVTDLRIAICDDDVLCREQVTAIVSSYKDQRGLDMELSIYESAAALLHDVALRGGFDLYLLDIIMPGENGIELGRQLRRESPEGKIIYLTSSHEYAVDSYRVRAFDYLIKPVAQGQLFHTLDEAIQTLAVKKGKSLIVRTKESSTKVSFESIMYAKLAGKSIAYHLTNGVTVEGVSIRTTFSEAISELLLDERFALCGSGTAVNLYHVTTVDGDTLYFKNGGKLYIGLRAGRSLRSVWMDFWMNREGSK